MDLAAEVAERLEGHLREGGMPLHDRYVELFADLLADRRSKLIQDLLVRFVCLCLEALGQIVQRSCLEKRRDPALDHEAFEQRLLRLELLLRGVKRIQHGHHRTDEESAYVEREHVRNNEENSLH